MFKTIKINSCNLILACNQASSLSYNIACYMYRLWNIFIWHFTLTLKSSLWQIHKIGKIDLAYLQTWFYTWLITLLGHVGCPGNIPATADGALCKANCSSGISPATDVHYTYRLCYNKYEILCQTMQSYYHKSITHY